MRNDGNVRTAQSTQTPNYGLTDAQRKRDYLAGSWLRKCQRCKKTYCDTKRDGSVCRGCNDG